MSVSIREALEDDYLYVAKLIKNELGYKELNIDKLYNRLRLMKSDDKHLTVVAEYEGFIVGFIGIYKGIAYNYSNPIEKPHLGKCGFFNKGYR